jgi:ABC-type transporter Mla MlaB component
LPPEVTLHTVPGILQRVAGEKRCPEIVDFSDVTQADSAALAILLAWQAQREEALQIKALPEQLAVLLHLYDLEKVLVV